MTMNPRKILTELKLGDGIAEYDKDLAKYFVDTVYVEDFVKDRYDIILGEKGSGKSAMLKGVTENAMNYTNLENVQMVIATNLIGDVDFRKAFASIDEDISEFELIDAWKIYIVNLLWKQYCTIFGEENDLKKYLESKKILEHKEGILFKLKYAIERARASKFTVYNKTQMDGTNEVGASLDLNKGEDSYECEVIDYNMIFAKLEQALEERDSNIWVLLDRLDDAFPDRNPKNTQILKALFYAYKDICAYTRIKVKIFIREDIFSDITMDGFRSLTHVSSKAMQPIKWDKEKIINMFIERLLYNKCIQIYMQELGIDYKHRCEGIDKKILDTILKRQVDIGKNKPDTIGWILNHIKNGKGVFTPRDFILLIDKARSYQLEEVKDKEVTDPYLIGASAIRKAYRDISKSKLDTQIYAEYPECRGWIEKFRDGKAAYNKETIKEILGKQWNFRVNKLVFIGFLEESGGGWNIPFLYRPALKAVQGKAYKN